ncbi:hypothetical protein [Parabacteroides distasonis]
MRKWDFNQFPGVSARSAIPHRIARNEWEVPSIVAVKSANMVFWE